jgi:hypothetical protein
VKPGDLVRFQEYGYPIYRKGKQPKQSLYWVIGLCVLHNKVQHSVSILYKGKIIKQHSSRVEKAGKKDVKYRRPCKD